MGFLRRLGAKLQRADSSSVLNELALWSPSLLDTNHMFPDIAKYFTITTFYEQEKTHRVQVCQD